MQMNLAHKFQNQQIHHAPQAPQQQPHGQHHHSHHQQAQDNGGHGAGALGGHQHTFSSGALNATPHFTPNHLQNGLQGEATGGSGKYSDNWRQQLILVQESRQAREPHHYARTYAHHNKIITHTPKTGARKENEREERNRVSNTEKRRQDWQTIDFSGQGCRSLSVSLFRYTFLEKMHLNFNKLTYLPAAIGQLKNLAHLDVSNNQIREIPPEIGMLVNMKQLLIFDNDIQTLPHEMGSMFQLETLGIEGNPLQEEFKSEIMQNGTKALITHLRESAPGMFF